MTVGAKTQPSKGASITITDDGIRIEGALSESLAKTAALVHPEFGVDTETVATDEEAKAIAELNARHVARETRRAAKVNDERAVQNRYSFDPIMTMHPDSVRKVAEQQALFGGWDEPDEPFDRVGPLAVITISGPLMQRGGWWWDGYESIRWRVGEALSADGVGAVALLINSPGGVAAGCFEAAKAMRKMAEAAGKPVFAFADEMAYSAGYAMACVASEIYLPDPGGIGSVGVIGVLYDMVKFNEDLGFNIVVVASGDQKADGHPDLPLSEEAIARYRDRTNQLAGLFAELVGEARGKSTAEVLGLQAGCFYGRGAVTAGLANGVKTRDQFLAYAHREAKKALPQVASAKAVKQVAFNTNNQTASSGHNAEGKTMAMITLAAIALALGLKHDADEDACAARGKELLDFERDALKETGAENADDALGAMKAGKIALEQLPKVSAELASLKTEKDKGDVEAMISEAKAAGKITTTEFEAEMRDLGAENPKRLKSTLSKLPAVVTASKATTEPSVTVTLTSEEIQVARQMGISPETLMKNKAEQAATAKGEQ